MKIDLPTLNLPGLTTNARFKFYELYPRGQVALETKAQLEFLYELNNNGGSRLNQYNIPLPKNIFKKTRFNRSNKAQLNYSKFLKLRNAYYSAMDPYYAYGYDTDAFFGLNMFWASELINYKWVYSKVFYINTFHNPALDMSFKKLPLDQDYTWMTADIPGVSNKYNETMSLNSLLDKIKTDCIAGVDKSPLLDGVAPDGKVMVDLGLVEPVIVYKTFIIEGSKFTVITSLHIYEAMFWRLVNTAKLTPEALKNFTTYWSSLNQKCTEYLNSMPYIDLVNGLSKFTEYLYQNAGSSDKFPFWFRYLVGFSKYAIESVERYGACYCFIKAKMYVHIED